jgi:arylsulfatase A-like enzyme
VRNVVLITVDTLRPDRMSVYGYERDTTPELRRFFAGGTRFVRATSSAPCTLPAVQQLLTGTLDPRGQSPTLAERLGTAGFDTVGIVSHHFFSTPDEPNPAFSRGFRRFDVQGPEDRDQHQMTTRRAGEVSDRAIAFLRERSGDEPFLLWLHYFDPHDPYDPPEGYDVVERTESPPYPTGDRRTYHRERKRAPFEPQQTAWFRDRYDAEIRYTDEQVGRVLHELERRGLVESSVVVLTSDHGEWLGEGGRWDHCRSLAETELRVPMLIRVGGAPVGDRGEVTEVLASTLDVVPTVLALVTGSVPEGLEGLDLRGASAARHAVAIWHGEVAVRDRDWKLVVNREEPDASALYHLSEDPQETRNLFGRNPEVQAALEAEAVRVEIDVDDVRLHKLTQQLMAIGYIEPKREFSEAAGVQASGTEAEVPSPSPH